MSKLLVIIGAAVGGWVGWWLGGLANMTTAYFLSVLGTAVGVYFGRRVAQRLG